MVMSTVYGLMNGSSSNISSSIQAPVLATARRFLLSPIHFATLDSPSLDTCQMTK